jgi:hypothetical protein
MRGGGRPSRGAWSVALWCCVPLRATARRCVVRPRPRRGSRGHPVPPTRAPPPQIYELETKYLEGCNPAANALRGEGAAGAGVAAAVHLQRTALPDAGAPAAAGALPPPPPPMPARPAPTPPPGYEGLLSQPVQQYKKPAGHVRAEDRLFSGSSLTGWAHLPGAH